MFYLDGVSLSKIKLELKENLLNKKVGKIFQNSSLSLTLHFGKKALFFTCNPSMPLCYINEDKEENLLEESSNFLLMIRKYLVNSALVDLEQLGLDRILKFSFSKINELGQIQNNYLFFEIMGKYSNVILTDSDERIISVLKKKSIEENSIRTLFNGEKYSQPIVSQKKNPFEITETEFNTIISNDNIIETLEGIGKLTKNEIKNYQDFRNILTSELAPKIYFNKKVPVLATVLEVKPKEYDEVINYPNFCEMINFYIKSKSLSNSFNLLREQLISCIEKEKKKSEKIIKNIKKDIEIMKDYNKHKEIGDILASVLYSIKRGDTTVKAYDFYNNCEINISLDPLLSPQSNLEKIYKKSSKMKRGLEISKQRLEEFQNKLFYFDSVATDIITKKLLVLVPSENFNEKIIFLIIITLILNFFLGGAVTTSSVVIPTIAQLGILPPHSAVLTLFVYTVVSIQYILPFHHATVMVGFGEGLYGNKVIIKYGILLTVLTFFIVLYICIPWWKFIDIL